LAIGGEAGAGIMASHDLVLRAGVVLVQSIMISMLGIKEIHASW
jgi:hypothetical protein